VDQEMLFSLVLESLVGWNQRGGRRKIICKMEGDGGQSGHVIDEGGCCRGEGGYSIISVSHVVDLV